MRPGRTVQSVDRALALVDALAREPAGLTLTALARRAGLAVQTAQSLLRTLQRHAWVVQGGRGAPYRLGPAIGALHRRWSAHLDRAAAAAEPLQALSRELGEYVVIAEWAGDRLSPIAEARPDRELTVRGETFRRERLHVMATGKLLLACLGEAERRTVVGGLSLEKAGPRSVGTAEALLADLRVIRSQGYACCEDEAALGVVALAVPVGAGGEGPPAAALGVSLPSVRYRARLRPRLLARLSHTARDIAAAWGLGEEIGNGFVMDDYRMEKRVATSTETRV